jgi:uncharacterized LabA/DUF88 family protein
MKRITVFIDAQNAYRTARDLFFARTDSSSCGQFDPLKLGELICRKKPPGWGREARCLHQVRIYTGRPESSKDPRTYAAHMRQCSAWENKGVTVKPRTLRYPFDWPNSPAEEKGIDVALALDFVTLAVDRDYDVGVIVSTDTDLRPALEYVIEKGLAIVEVAAWHTSFPRGLSLPNKPVWCHRLARADYDSVADYRDYNIRHG